MARRTTPDKVAAVLQPGSDYDGKSDLYPFIDWATSMVDFVVNNASKYGRTAPTDLATLETWLAAHAYKQSDQQLQNKSQGGVSGSFRGQTGEGLKGTLYGRTALSFDTSRILAAIDEGRIAGSAWLGKPPSSQIAYKDRS